MDGLSADEFARRIETACNPGSIDVGELSVLKDMLTAGMSSRQKLDFTVGMAKRTGHGAIDFLGQMREAMADEDTRANLAACQGYISSLVQLIEQFANGMHGEIRMVDDIEGDKA